jgi:hypothetical protein
MILWEVIVCMQELWEKYSQRVNQFCDEHIRVMEQTFTSSVSESSALKTNIVFSVFFLRMHRHQVFTKAMEVLFQPLNR